MFFSVPLLCGDLFNSAIFYSIMLRSVLLLYFIVVLYCTAFYFSLNLLYTILFHSTVTFNFIIFSFILLYLIALLYSKLFYFI